MRTITTFDHIQPGTRVFVLEYKWPDKNYNVKQGIIVQVELRVTEDDRFLVYLILVDGRDSRSYWGSREVFTDYETAKKEAAARRLIF